MLVRLVKDTAMTDFVSLYEAKTHLSHLVDRAASGEEIVITKNGVPLARLVGAPPAGVPRRPVNALGVTRISKDFDEPMPEFEKDLYGNADEEA